jgi:hypothetical protein
MKDTSCVGGLDRRGFTQLAAAGAGLAGRLSAAVAHSPIVSPILHFKPRYALPDPRWSKPWSMSMNNPPNRTN